MEINNFDINLNKQKLQNSSKKSSDVSFQNVLSDKFNALASQQKLLPADQINQMWLLKNKKRKDLEDEMALHVADDEDSVPKSFKKLKESLKKLVAIERLFLNI